MSPVLFQENPVTIIEAHLLDRSFETQGDFYGQPLQLCLVGFLRPEQKFPSFDLLIAQIQADIATARHLTTGPGGSSDEMQRGRRLADAFFAGKNAADALVWERQQLL